MKTRYTAAIATLAGIAIGGMAVQALHAQAKPRAYAVIEIDVLNQDAFFKEFVPVAVKTIMDQGGKFLARGGKLVNIEGPGPLYSEVKRLTVVEFENNGRHGCASRSARNTASTALPWSSVRCARA